MAFGIDIVDDDVNDDDDAVNYTECVFVCGTPHRMNDFDLDDARTQPNSKRT